MLRFVNIIPMYNRGVIFPHNPVQFFPGYQLEMAIIYGKLRVYIPRVNKRVVEKEKRSGREPANPSGILEGLIKFERGVNLRSQVIPDGVSVIAQRKNRQGFFERGLQRVVYVEIRGYLDGKAVGGNLRFFARL